MRHIPDDPVFASSNLLKGFKNAEKPAPIELEALEREYCYLTGQSYPIVEMVFVRSWMLFRVCMAPFGIARERTDPWLYGVTAGCNLAGNRGTLRSTAS
jgi:hypothetical protein